VNLTKEESMKPASSASIGIALLLSLAASPLAAQSAPACARAEHRQFDFWVGEWNVTLPNGRPAGTNRIQSINAGCGLREEWTGAGGSTGTSLNAFDPTTGRWHQTWIGSDGTLLLLDGGLRDGAMELSGVTAGADGAKTLHRIRWTPLGGSPAALRQLWESSADGGQTWTVAFDGKYERQR
jgi:hypothetical protein